MTEIAVYLQLYNIGQYIFLYRKETVVASLLHLLCVGFSAAEGKPPGAASGIHASEIDRTYVVLSWRAPAYFSKAPMWYYIEKVTWSTVNDGSCNRPTALSVWKCRSGLKEQDKTLLYALLHTYMHRSENTLTRTQTDDTNTAENNTPRISLVLYRTILMCVCIYCKAITFSLSLLPS